MKKWLSVYIALFILMAISVGEAEELMVGHFSAIPQDVYPEGWKPLVFEKIDKHTEYTHILDGTTGVIEADSRQSSSGLIKSIEISPDKWPVISWRWKIDHILQKGDVSKKSGDDYPARIYVTFKYEPDKVSFYEKIKFNIIKLFYGEYPPTSAINYIWANKAEQGLFVDNPYTDRVKMIVIESGSAKQGQWILEKRNIVDDYRKAFNEDPPVISGIAIMTDTDNTQESNKAWYGDIVFTKSPLADTFPQ